MVPSTRFPAFLRSCAVCYRFSGSQNTTPHCAQKANNLYQHKSYHDFKFLKERRTQDLEMRMNSKKDPYLNFNKTSYKLSDRKGPSCDEPKKPKTSACEEPKKANICEEPKKSNVIDCEKPKKELVCTPCPDDNQTVEFGYSEMDQCPDLIPWEERCKSKSQNMHIGAGILTMAITTVVTWYALKTSY